MKRGIFFFLAFCLVGAFVATNAYAVVVRNADQLEQAIVRANAGGDKNILLQNGTYTITGMLWVSASGVTVRSVSGNRNSVIIQSTSMTRGASHIFNVAGSNFTARDMTLRMVANHAVQFQPSSQRPVLRNLVFQDTGEQMVKGAFDFSNPSVHSDNGLIENCLFEYRAGVGPQYYIGGIDVHRGRNWIVRNNVFKNIKSPESDLAEHAIHFWSDSENTLVERNLIINCDRGIGFGLGDRGHIGGTIRNNMIFHAPTSRHSDVGIGLESARNAKVYNNTIYYQTSYPNAIEYRFGSTRGCLIANNLTNKAIARRDGGSASLSNNVTNAQASWFKNLRTGDLHLARSISTVVDKARAITGLTNDFDGHKRPVGSGYDIGADEYNSKPQENTRRIIQGYVRDKRRRPVRNIRILFSNGGGSTRTNSKGFYRRYVSATWRGTIRAEKACRSFRPIFKHIKRLTSTRTTVNFRMYNGVIVWGKVKNTRKKPLQNVLVTLTNRGGRAKTNKYGNYVRVVSCRWSGVLRAKKTGYRSQPSYKRLGRIRRSLTRVDFTMR